MLQFLGGIGALLIVLGVVTFKGLGLEWRVEYLRRQNIENAEEIASGYRFIGYSPAAKGVRASFKYLDDGRLWVVEHRFSVILKGCLLLFAGLALVLIAVLGSRLS
jgi:hypothetical protein